jgi:hypothetical protein
MIAGKSNGNASLSWKGKREKMHRKFEENLTRGLSHFFISLKFSYAAILQAQNTPS